MRKENLIWIARSLGLDTSGTVPEIERRVVIANTLADNAIIKLSDPDLAYVSSIIATLRHQLAARATFADLEPDVAKDYVFEEKLDGMRVWLVGYKQRAYVFSRHATKDLRLNKIGNIQNVFLDNFPWDTLGGLCIFDAELYIDDFSMCRQDRLGKAISAFSSIGRVAKRAKPVIIDVIMLNDKDVANEPYVVRRELLLDHCLSSFTNDQLVGDVHEIFDRVVVDQGGEGLVLKQKDCPYLFGERAGWHKLKVGYADGANEYDAIITGMGDRGKNKNLGLVGSVTISDVYGNPLGELGSFTDAVRRQLTGPSGLLKAEYVGKKIEVVAMELTRDGKLRHAAFKRFI